MWYLPGPGIKLVSSALQGRFLTTGPPGKSFSAALIYISLMISHVEHLFMFATCFLWKMCLISFSTYFLIELIIIISFNVELYKFIPRPWYGEGNGTPLQYSCLENPMDGGAW